MTEKHKWTFSGKFKRNGFGRKSDLPIQRLKEALSEIKAHVKKTPVLAAEGAVLLHENYHLHSPTSIVHLVPLAAGSIVLPTHTGADYCQCAC